MKAVTALAAASVSTIDGILQEMAEGVQVQPGCRQRAPAAHKRTAGHATLSSHHGAPSLQQAQQRKYRQQWEQRQQHPFLAGVDLLAMP